MKSEVVIGIDSSTTATKAVAWDILGKDIAAGSSPVRLFSPQPNYYEQDPDDWWLSAVSSLQSLVKQIDKEKIAAIAISNHTGHLYRAILEGIAMEQSLASKAVEMTTGESTEEFAVIGGGAKSGLWRQIIADACNKKVLNMSTDEASSLGAGISAAVAAGWYASFRDAAKNMVHVKGITEPIPQNAEQYSNQIIKYREIYPAVKGIGRKDANAKDFKKET